MTEVRMKNLFRMHNSVILLPPFFVPQWVYPPPFPQLLQRSIEIWHSEKWPREVRLIENVILIGWILSRTDLWLVLQACRFQLFSLVCNHLVSLHFNFHLQIKPFFNNCLFLPQNLKMHHNQSFNIIKNKTLFRIKNKKCWYIKCSSII